MANYTKGKISIPFATGNIIVNITATESGVVIIPIVWQNNTTCNYNVGDTLTFSEATNTISSDFISISPGNFRITGLEDAQIYAPSGYNFRVLGCNNDDVIQSVLFLNADWKNMALPVNFEVPNGIDKIVIRISKGNGAAGVYPALSNAVLKSV